MPNVTPQFRNYLQTVWNINATNWESISPVTMRSVIKAYYCKGVK